MLPPEKPRPAPKPKAAPPAAKSPSYWSRIAGALGLEVPQPAEPIVDERQAHRSQEPKHRRVEEPQAPPPERDFEPAARAPEPPPRGFEPRTSADVPVRSPLDEMFGSGPTSVDTFGKGVNEPRGREAAAASQREVGDSGSVLDYDVSAGSDLHLDKTDDREYRPRGEDEGPGDGRRRRRRRGRGRRGRGAGREELAPRRDEGVEPTGEEADLDYEREAPLSSAAGAPMDDDLTDELPQRAERLPRDEEGELFPPRREERDVVDEREGGRRRRRGRGRGHRDREDREGPEAERGAPFGPQREEPFGQRRDEPMTGERLSREDEDLDEHEPLGELDEGDEEQGGGLPTHKKIPTWEDALAILIEANMANHAANPDRDRGRGRGNGRGRGRR